MVIGTLAATIIAVSTGLAGRLLEILLSLAFWTAPLDRRLDRRTARVAAGPEQWLKHPMDSTGRKP